MDGWWLLLLFVVADEEPDFVPKMFKLFKICLAKFAGVVIIFVLSEFKFSFDFAGFSARFVVVAAAVVVVVVVIGGGGVGDILYLVVGFVQIFGIV